MCLLGYTYLVVIGMLAVNMLCYPLCCISLKKFSVSKFLIQSGIEEEDEEIARFRVSPPPTPINRFLQSVSIYRKNQIKLSIPRFILRGIGRGSYHVFEVKVILMY